MTEITDVLKLAEAISAKREGEKDFSDLMTEVSNTLAELLAAFEKRDGTADAKALGAVLTSSLTQALAAMKAPVVQMPAVNVPAPVINMPAANDWQQLKITNGEGRTWTIDRVAKKAGS